MVEGQVLKSLWCYNGEILAARKDKYHGEINATEMRSQEGKLWGSILWDCCLFGWVVFLAEVHKG